LIHQNVYQEFLEETFKQTSRLIPLRQPSSKLLLLLSHRLQKNIVLLELCNAKYFPHLPCKAYQAHHASCKAVLYKFQHYLYHFVNTSHPGQIVFCWYNKKCFLVANPKGITPLLINQPLQTSVDMDNYTLSVEDIWNILRQQPVNIKESVVLYSSYEYRKQYLPQSLKTNIIGVHVGNAKTMHLLLTPYLQTFQFYISMLPCQDELHRHVNLQNNLSISQQPEGIRLKSNVSSIPEKEESLSEHFCICQNTYTQKMTKKIRGQYNALGNKNKADYFRDEHPFF